MAACVEVGDGLKQVWVGDNYVVQRHRTGLPGSAAI